MHQLRKWSERALVAKPKQAKMACFSHVQRARAEQTRAQTGAGEEAVPATGRPRSRWPLVRRREADLLGLLPAWEAAGVIAGDELCLAVAAARACRVEPTPVQGSRPATSGRRQGAHEFAGEVRSLWA